MTYVHLTLPKCIEHTIGSGKIAQQMIAHGKTNPGCMLRWPQFEQLMSCLLQGTKISLEFSKTSRNFNWIFIISKDNLKFQ